MFFRRLILIFAQINWINSITDLQFSATDSENLHSSQWPEELQSLVDQIEGFVLYLFSTMVYRLGLVCAETMLVRTSRFRSDMVTPTMLCTQIRLSGKITRQWQNTIHKPLYCLQLLTS